MKIAFSNIAWERHDDSNVLSLLRHRGVAGIEVAPTRVWPEWEGATIGAAQRYRGKLQECGFEVPALQAVLFGRAEARLFAEDRAAAFVSHLSRIAEIASALGARVVVLGAPKHRDRGCLSMEEASDRATEVFSRLGEVFSSCDTCLCIEPNPRRYACNFIINAKEAATLVRRVNHRGFGLHLDAAAMFLEGEDLGQAWAEVGDLVRHFHISEPDLGDFCNPQVPHRRNLDILRSHCYTGWCSVEMREPSRPLSESGPWALLDGVA